MEFAKQYEANKAAWDKAIDFLRDRNLDLIAPGKYPIDGDNVFAIVTEPDPKKLDSAGYEIHKNYIDLHYVIKGEETIYTHAKGDSIAVTKPYDAAKDVENYFTKGEHFTAKPNAFFLFFPGELHAPGIRTMGRRKNW